MYAANSGLYAPKEVSFGARIKSVIAAFFRLILPTALLSIILFACYFELEDGVVALDLFPPHLWEWNPGYWLTMGHLMLPLSFFVVNLTSRRRGPSYALGQVLLSWLSLGLMTFIVLSEFGNLSSESLFPPAQTTMAFIVAFMLAQLVNIRVFDRTRGRTWWGAPFVSILWASVIFVIIFYPVSMMGQGQSFVPRMVTDLVLKTLSAGLLLLPYYLLRPMIKPAPGYGGA